MTTPQGPSGTSQDRAAELLAAVRAVESGEASAASFFTRPEPTGGRRPAAPAGRSAPPQPTPLGVSPEAGPVSVPAGLPELLAQGGAPAALAESAVRQLGEPAAEVLRADPWQLLALPGVQPDQADAFARVLLGDACGPDDVRRGCALADWLLARAALAGHTVLTGEALQAGLARYAVPDPAQTLREVLDSGAVLVFRADGSAAEPESDAFTHELTDEFTDEFTAGGAVSGPAEPTADGADSEPGPVPLLFGLERYALAEESLADGLARLSSTFVPPAPRVATAESADGSAPDPQVPDPHVPDPQVPDGTADAGAVAQPARSDWALAADRAGSPSAAELVRAAAASGLVLHTGGEAARAEPAALVAAARALRLRAYAAAHTEDGRRRLTGLLTERTGPGDAPTETATETSANTLADAAGEDPAAVTLAGLLDGAQGPGRDADGVLALDLLAVLDAPQLDVESAAALVESLPDGARLVLSGDPQLLGSAGPGQPFRDLLAARCCPLVVSRTPDPGPLGELVSGIGVGELTEVAAPDREVVIVPVRDAGEAVHRTVQLVADSVPRAIGVPTEQTQVITVGHGGAAGTRALNAALKERLNPGPGRFGGFDPGDRVAHSPAPGRTSVCTVVSGDAEGLHLRDDTGAVVVPQHRVAGTVRHGWALTAHQAAGARWPAAVVVLPGDSAPALDRTWVYTAFSRGERHLSVVQGAEQALPQAVTGPPTADRATRLRSLLAPSSATPDEHAGGLGT